MSRMPEGNPQGESAAKAEERVAGPLLQRLMIEQHFVRMGVLTSDEVSRLNLSGAAKPGMTVREVMSYAASASDFDGIDDGTEK